MARSCRNQQNADIEVRTMKSLRGQFGSKEIPISSARILLASEPISLPPIGRPYPTRNQHWRTTVHKRKRRRPPAQNGGRTPASPIVALLMVTVTHYTWLDVTLGQHTGLCADGL